MQLLYFADCHAVGLVDADNIGKLDLKDEEVGDVSLNRVVELEFAVVQVFEGEVVSEEFLAIGDGDHGVEAGDVSERGAEFVDEAEGGGDGHGFGDAGGLDEEIVETVLLDELTHLFQQAVAQSAADTAVGHFDELCVDAAEASTLSD